MRILLVTRRFRPLIGGAESVLWHWSREMVCQGHEVTVLTARWEDYWPKQERPDRVDVQRIDQPKTRIWGTWHYMRGLRHWLRCHGKDYDICYVSMLKHSAWVCLKQRSFMAIPVVLRTEGAGATGDVQWQGQTWVGGLIRKKCRTADALVAVSPQITQELESAGYERARIHTISNAVPVPRPWDSQERLRWRKIASLPIECDIAVYAGRLSPEKGVQDLLASWPKVRSRCANAHLVIVGTGPQEQELRGRSQQAVTCVGASTNVQRYLRAADLFVLPSHYEGTSIALLEAMALGMPVVATSIGGNRQLIRDRQDGLLVPDRNPGLLADAIARQLCDSAEARQMAASARRRVQQEFSIRHMVQRHLDLFRSLC